MMPMLQERQRNDAAASTLAAIAIAARRAGDNGLLRLARRELQERHGVKISFAREAKAADDAK